MATKQKPDAIALLKADHRAVDELFQKFESSRSADKKAELAQKICMELTIHTLIEEEIFYPACKDQIEQDLLEEAYVEHDGAKLLIAEIEAGSPNDAYFDAKVKVLSEQIKHHVKEEEKRSEGMFAQARDAGLDVDALGRQMMERKEALQAQFDRDGLPTPKTRTFSENTISHASA